MDWFAQLMDDAQRFLRTGELFAAGVALAEATEAALQISDPHRRSAALTACQTVRSTGMRQQLAVQCRLDKLDHEEKLRTIRERQPKARRLTLVKGDGK